MDSDLVFCVCVCRLQVVAGFVITIFCEHEQRSRGRYLVVGAEAIAKEKNNNNEEMKEKRSAWNQIRIGTAAVSGLLVPNDTAGTPPAAVKPKTHKSREIPSGSSGPPRPQDWGEGPGRGRGGLLLHRAGQPTWTVDSFCMQADYESETTMDESRWASLDFNLKGEVGGACKQR